MAQTKRAQVLMEPEEYARLEEIALQKGISVAELIRSAVRERYLQRAEDKAQALEQILGLNLPQINWQSAEEEIEAAHHARLP